MISRRNIVILVTTAFLLGFVTGGEACSQKKSKSKQKKSSTSKNLSKKQLEAWINQLGEGSFRERRTASNNLLKAGKQALPALVKGAQRKDAELAKRCFDIIIKMYRGKNETLSSAAEKALGELEKSSNKSVANRAKKILQKLQNAINAIKRLRGMITLDKTGKVRKVYLGGSKVTRAIAP